MKKFNICISKAVRFNWKLHRLTLKDNPPIYHWLWFTFSYYNHDDYKKENNYKKAQI